MLGKPRNAGLPDIRCEPLQGLQHVLLGQRYESHTVSSHRKLLQNNTHTHTHTHTHSGMEHVDPLLLGGHRVELVLLIHQLAVGVPVAMQKALWYGTRTSERTTLKTVAVQTWSSHGYGSKPRTPSEHPSPHQNRLKWVVNSPTPKWDPIGVDPRPHVKHHEELLSLEGQLLYQNLELQGNKFASTTAAWSRTEQLARCHRSASFTAPCSSTLVPGPLGWKQA